MVSAFYAINANNAINAISEIYAFYALQSGVVVVGIGREKGSGVDPPSLGSYGATRGKTETG